MSTVKLLQSMAVLSTFSRGLPTRQNLLDTPLAQIFRQVLLEGSIIMEESPDLLSRTPMVKSPLRTCFVRGWLHNSEILNDNRVAYTFPSPLHMRYVQCLLLGNEGGHTEMGITTHGCEWRHTGRKGIRGIETYIHTLGRYTASFPACSFLSHRPQGEMTRSVDQSASDRKTPQPHLPPTRHVPTMTPQRRGVRGRT